MTDDLRLTFFHAPNTRSSGALALLEELGAPYELHVLDIKSGQQRTPEYRAVNPMGKVPAIRHGDAVVTEQGAVFLYLAELFPQAGLAPALGDPQRGAFLRWLFFYGSSFEPAVVDRAMKREPAPYSTSPYGDYDSVISTLTAALEKGPYLLGERFSAADVLWGSALHWTTGFKLVPEHPALRAYIDRVTARPAFARARQKDAELAASQAASSKESS